MPIRHSVQLKVGVPAVTLTEVRTLVNKRWKPLVIHPGEIVPLTEALDIASFVKSVASGVLHNMLADLSNPRMSLVEEQVSDQVARLMDDARAKLNMPTNYGPQNGGFTETVSLEPGCQVAVGHFPDVKVQQPVPEPMKAPVQPTYLEQGVQAGVARAPEAPMEMTQESMLSGGMPKMTPMKPLVPSNQPGVQNVAPTDPIAAQSAGSPHSHWKDGLSFEQAKKVISESGDEALVRWVAENEVKAGVPNTLGRIAAARIQK